MTDMTGPAGSPQLNELAKADADQRPPDRYFLNRNDDVDTLHRNPGNACNTERSKTKDGEVIDEATALRLQMRGMTQLCRHCYPTTNEEGHI